MLIVLIMLLDFDFVCKSVSLRIETYENNHNFLNSKK